MRERPNARQKQRKAVPRLLYYSIPPRFRQMAAQKNTGPGPLSLPLCSPLSSSARFPPPSSVRRAAGSAPVERRGPLLRTGKSTQSESRIRMVVKVIFSPLCNTDRGRGRSFRDGPGLCAKKTMRLLLLKYPPPATGPPCLASLAAAYSFGFSPLIGRSWRWPQQPRVRRGGPRAGDILE